MKKKIKQILIVQLSIIEVILFAMLFDSEQTSCVVEKENKNLLVYNYSANTLLAPNIVKEEVVLTTNEIEEQEDTNEEEIVVEEAAVDAPQEVVVLNPKPVVKPISKKEPEIINDVDYSKAQNLVEYAKQFVGYPYVYGGNSLTSGTDCSGFTQLIYAKYGVTLPRTSRNQAYAGVEVPVSQIQIGDLVLSGYNGKTHHVAIYIGDNKIIQALNSDVGIVITNLYHMPITHVRRVL